LTLDEWIVKICTGFLSKINQMGGEDGEGSLIKILENLKNLLKVLIVIVFVIFANFCFLNIMLSKFH
jgi:hypothetical protein